MECMTTDVVIPLFPGSFGFRNAIGTERSVEVAGVPADFVYTQVVILGDFGDIHGTRGAIGNAVARPRGDGHHTLTARVRWRFACTPHLGKAAVPLIYPIRHGGALDQFSNAGNGRAAAGGSCCAFVRCDIVICRARICHRADAI
jgi:hypothetical protein